MRVLLVFTVVLLGIAGCRRVAPANVTERTEVQRLARIIIPPSAIALQCRAEYGKDACYYGRFDIPAAVLLTVLDRMPKDEKVQPCSGYSNVTSYKMSEPWWQPLQLREPRVAQWSEPGFSLNLMFGESGQPGMLTA